MVAPVIAAVVRYELRRERDVPGATRGISIAIGGACLYAGLAAAMVGGVWPGAVVALPAVMIASWQLRARGGRAGQESEHAN